MANSGNYYHQDLLDFIFIYIEIGFIYHVPYGSYAATMWLIKAAVCRIHCILCLRIHCALCLAYVRHHLHPLTI